MQKHGNNNVTLVVEENDTLIINNALRVSFKTKSDDTVEIIIEGEENHRIFRQEDLLEMKRAQENILRTGSDVPNFPWPPIRTGDNSE